MASGKVYLQYVLEQLSGLEGITFRPMMGEYILYYQGKIVGGIYDDRLLVKPVRAAAAQFDNPVCQLPYPGAKPMLLVEQVDDRVFLETLFRAMYAELPAPGKAKPRRDNAMKAGKIP